MTLIMTGVASTGTRPLPMRGAVCSTPTSSSDVPFIPVFNGDRSIMGSRSWAIAGARSVGHGRERIVPDAVWKFN